MILKHGQTIIRSMEVFLRMSRYTITLDRLITSGFQIFNDTWTTYVPEHKAELCDKIVNHYRFNEIGAETPARFKHYLNTQLCEIMPYYNMLYETALQDMLPLYNHWLETTTEGNEILKEHGQQAGRTDKAMIQMIVNSLKDTSNRSSVSNYDSGKVGSKKWDETDIIDGSEKEHTVTDYTEKTVTDEDAITDYTHDITGTDDETDTENSTKQTDTTRHQDVRGTSNTTRTEWSSDTPQGQIVNNQLNIDATYLTNYTHSSENTTTTETTDETINTTETFEDKTVKDRDTTENKVSKETLDRVINGTKDSTTTTDRQLTTKEIIDKAGHENTSSTQNDETKARENQVSTHFEETKTDNKAVDTTAQDTITDKDTTNKAHTIVKGNVGVTRADLIRKYREVYINIDLEIIKALAINFMGIF